jgi:hypothetical protein
VLSRQFFNGRYNPTQMVRFFARTEQDKSEKKAQYGFGEWGTFERPVKKGQRGRHLADELAQGFFARRKWLELPHT